MKSINIALVGNPNSGKTTLFNALSGAKAHVGNWPGVTVEKKEARYKKDRNILITDLPGIYSLSPFSLEEVITRDFIIDEKPDVLVNIVDASNLERNLYLSTQLIEIHPRVIIALNMMDVVRKRGYQIDIKQLEDTFGCPVVQIAAIKEEGMDELYQAILTTFKKEAPIAPLNIYNDALQSILNELAGYLPHHVTPFRKLFCAIKLFEKDETMITKLQLSEDQISKVQERIHRAEETLKDDSTSIIVNARYGFISTHQDQILKAEKSKLSITDKIDKVITNKYLAMPLFFLVMWIIYFISIQWLGEITIGWMETFFGETVANFLSNLLILIDVAPWMQDLIINGIVAGVGGVLVFIPQLMILFFLLSILEDSGYMARVAFNMDKVFRKFGLSGKSFIPMVIGTGCSVPAIMSARTIENERERKLTIMLTPFIPCSAKLPVFALFIAAFFHDQSYVAPMLYLIGLITAILMGLLLKKSALFKGDASTFVMELPEYKLPSIKNVFIHTWDKGKSFIVRAGTVIFAASVVLWFLQSFSWSLEQVDTSHSILQSLGNIIAPLFAPLGFGNWESSVAIITGVLAKESVVATFSVLLGEDTLYSALQMIFTPVSAFSFMIFILLSSPCISAISATKREMGSWKWTFLTILIQTGAAYIISLFIYQIGNLIF